MRFRRCSLLCIAGMATATFSAASTAPPARPPDRESEPAPQATADIASSYAIHWHAIAAGTARMRNSCFRLAATIGQPAPGYSTNANFIVAAGFWAGAPTSGQDDLFFSGFERCTP